MRLDVLEWLRLVISLVVERFVRNLVSHPRCARAIRYLIGFFPGTPIARLNAMNLDFSPLAVSKFVRTASIPPRSLMVSCSLPAAEAASSENTSSKEVFPLPFAPITTLSGFSVRATSWSAEPFHANALENTHLGRPIKEIIVGS